MTTALQKELFNIDAYILEGGDDISNQLPKLRRLPVQQREEKPPAKDKGDKKVAFNRLYGKYKHSAVTRGLSFCLTKDQLYRLVRQGCHYCGALPEKAVTTKNKRHCFLCNGVDRKDNSKGYTPENSLPCCSRCNSAKSDMPYDDFLAWIEKVYKHTFPQQFDI